MLPAETRKIAIVGGGAAGFFSAINIARKKPGYLVHIFEKTSKLLAKVRVSGGGRCNVTHACFDNNLLVKNYPRGEKELRNVFSRFTVTDTIRWFEDLGISLKTEDDGRMFPESNSSESIVNGLLQEARRLSISIHLQSPIRKIERNGEQFLLHLADGLFSCDALVICSGGHPAAEQYTFIAELGHQVKPPVPSLFTFNLPGHPVTRLMGVVAKEASIRLPGTSLSSTGPLLITHWGFSGPAVLKLSAYAAEQLHQKNYTCVVLINWVNLKEEAIRATLTDLQQTQQKSSIGQYPAFSLPRRLWEYLLDKIEIPSEKPWREISKKDLNKLVQLLFSDEYGMKGKTTFKEEFVSCGGVLLKEVNIKTMESKMCKGLYFAGEVLDIDGVTGGFNFQAAWSTAWMVSENIP